MLRAMIVRTGKGWPFRQYLDKDQHFEVGPGGTLLIKKGEWLDAVYNHDEWSIAVWVKKEKDDDAER